MTIRAAVCAALLAGLFLKSASAITLQALRELNTTGASHATPVESSS